MGKCLSLINTLLFKRRSTVSRDRQIAQYVSMYVLGGVTEVLIKMRYFQCIISFVVYTCILDSYNILLFPACSMTISLVVTNYRY